MRNSTALLFLLTGVICLYWSVELSLTGMYGIPFSWWYAVVFAGSLVLILGAILSWVTGRRPIASWVGFVGSIMLAAYFIPDIAMTIRRYALAQASGSIYLAIRIAVALLVIASLVVAGRNMLHMKAR